MSNSFFLIDPLVVSHLQGWILEVTTGIAGQPDIVGRILVLDADQSNSTDRLNGSMRLATWCGSLK